MLFVCGVVVASAGQHKQITGTVIQSEYGEPVPGVTVRVNGTWRGVATRVAETDANFNYINNPDYKTKTNKQ